MMTKKSLAKFKQRILKWSYYEIKLNKKNYNPRHDSPRRNKGLEAFYAGMSGQLIYKQ